MTPRRTRLLRNKAEAQLAQAEAPPIELSPGALLHELQVHQIELEMQNDELRRAEEQLAQARDRYVDLYEFAPVGYLTLTGAVITEINLTGARLLGKERRQILRRRFSRFIAPRDAEAYHRMLAQASGQVAQLLAERGSSDAPQPSAGRHRGSIHSCAVALLQSSGETIDVQLDCVPWIAAEPAVLRISITDISERKRHETLIEELAFYDPLTKLPNRRLLLDRVHQAILGSMRTRQTGALLMLDLDSFKLLNDTRGHDAGDLLLQQTAERLVASVREVDTVGRLGGDEFAVLLNGLHEEPTKAAAQVKSIGEKILASLGAPYRLGRQEHRSTASIGVALFEQSRETVEQLLKRADLALYRAKSVGGGTLRFFDPELQAALRTRAALESDLRAALRQKRFLLHYQPQVDAAGRLIGAEALLRWEHPSLGLLTPDSFLALAEEKGLMVPIGRFVVDAACRRLAEWARSPATRDLDLAINLSSGEFCHPESVTNILEALAETGADPARLILEVTEGFMLSNFEATTACMKLLSAHGLRFSLDDFGRGFFSLSALRDLPFDQMKIDRSFVRNMLTGKGDAAIISSILTLGERLGVCVVAEGVETTEQWRQLVEWGCPAFQGYLFGAPGGAEQLRAMETQALVLWSGAAVSDSTCVGELCGEG